MLELELKQPFIWNETVDESENIEFRNNKYLFCQFFLLFVAIRNFATTQSESIFW